MTEARPSATERAWPRALPPPPPHVAGRDVPLASRAADLAQAARLFRGAARHPRSGSDLALALTHLEDMLDDLASGAELAAHAVIAHSRPPGAPVTSPAPPEARSVSWRLHALRSRLIAARDTCAAVHRAGHAGDLPG